MEATGATAGDSAGNMATTVAQPPFHGHKRADVVLRTSDHVDFCVHKLVLGLASPFFDRMFSAPPTDDPYSNLKPSTEFLTVNGIFLQIVPVNEDSKVIDLLLRHSYPTTHPPLPTDLALLMKALEASLKYELGSISGILQPHVLTFIPSHPLVIYSLACRLRLEDIALAAAKEWREKCARLIGTSTVPAMPAISTTPGPALARGSFFFGTPPAQDAPAASKCGPFSHASTKFRTLPCSTLGCPHRDPLYDVPEISDTVFSSSYIPEMGDITAACYFRLLQYVKDPQAVRAFCDPPPSSQSATEVEPAPHSNIWENFLSLPADIVLSSSGGQIFYAHQAVLAMASAHTILSQCQTDGHIYHDGSPLVKLEEDGKTLSALLHTCYTLGCTTPTNPLSPEQTLRAYNAAKKYTMQNAMSVAGQRWRSFVAESPLWCYLIATRLETREEAREAARAPMMTYASSVEGVYSPEMEIVPAGALHSLYKCHHVYRQERAKTLGRYLQNQMPTFPPKTIQQTAVSEEVLAQGPLPLVVAPLYFRALQNSPFGIDSPSTLIKTKHLVEESHSIVNELTEIADKVTSLMIGGEAKDLPPSPEVEPVHQNDVDPVDLEPGVTLSNLALDENMGNAPDDIPPQEGEGNEDDDIYIVPENHSPPARKKKKGKRLAPTMGR